MRRTVLAAAALLALWTGAAAGQCGVVRIGHMPWDASKVVAAIQARLLEEAFACIVEQEEMIEQPVLQSFLDKPGSDLLVGVWLHELSAEGREAVIDGRLVPLADLFVGGSREGWWVPVHLVGDSGTMRTIEDVIESFEFFVESGEEKGTFHNCPESWACRVVNDHLFEAYGLDTFFVNRPAESGEALRDSIRRAGEFELPWFGYYWAPNAILGEVPMRMVELNELDAAGYRCNSRPGCGAPHAGRYPAWRALTMGRGSFVRDLPAEAAALRRVSVEEAEMNRLLALLESDVESVETVAENFVAANEALWRSWLAAAEAEAAAAAPEDG